MAIYHFSAKAIGRGEGRSAVAAAAYRSASRLEDTRTGEVHDYSRKRGVEHTDIVMPAAATGWRPNRAELWSAAEKANGRGDAIIAREFEISLPHELTPEQRKALAYDFARHLVARYDVACDIAIHAPGRGGDERNHHVHIMVTAKRIKSAGFGTKAIELDPIASQRNAATRDNPNGVAVLREVWAALTNAALEVAGHDTCIDHRSLEARGIDQEPTQHVGPNATAMERRGKPTERGDANRDIITGNKGRGQAVDELDSLTHAIRDVAAEQANREAGRAERAAARTLDPERILQTVTDRRSTFSRAHLDMLLRDHFPDRQMRQEAVTALLACPDIIGLREQADGPVIRYTTRAVLSAEQDILDGARVLAGLDGRGLTPRQQERALRRHRFLDPEQRAAFLAATGAGGFVVIAGEAGTGKSTALRAIHDAYTAAGYRVQGLAWTNAVVQDLRGEGFIDAATIASELKRIERGSGSWGDRTVLMVDEAAMLSTRHLAALMGTAAAIGAKVILTGDERQLASIERGGMFGALQQAHGAAELHQVRRVADLDQRRAFNQMHKGNFRPALEIFHRQGAIHWAPTAEAARADLVARYTADVATAPSKSRFVFAASNAEVASLNQDIRALRCARGELGSDHQLATSDGLTAFAAGDRIIFTETAAGQDARAAGFINGTVGTVRAIEGARLTVVLDGKAKSSARVLSFTVGKDEIAGEFHGIRHGYAGTIYKGQGRTLDQTYVLHAPAMSAATSYVALSRHRERASLFVAGTVLANKAAQPAALDRLARQMARVDDRRSASQFHLAPAQAAQPALWPPRGRPHAPARTQSSDSAARAAEQVRAAAAQFNFQRSPPEPASSPRLVAAPRGRDVPDAALSAAQVRAAADILAEMIVMKGGIADVVTDLVQDGLAWWQRIAHRTAELVKDVRETVLGWREQVRHEHQEHEHDMGLDFD